MKPRAGLGFVLPALFVLALLTLYPVVYTAVLSVTNDQGQFVGLHHFETTVRARLTGIAVHNTIVYVSASILCQMVIGTIAGVLLNQPFRGRGLVRSIALIPWVVPGIVAATTWAWMLHTEFGIVNHLLMSAGLIAEPVGWLTDRDVVMPAVVAINVWKMCPFVAIMVLAALQTVPGELYEAARVDGATFRDEVRYVMLPHIAPVLASIALLLTIWGLNGITIIYTVTRGGPANATLIVPIQIYRQAFESLQFHEAAALSAMFFVCTLALVAVYIRLSGAGREGRS